MRLLAWSALKCGGRRDWRGYWNACCGRGWNRPRGQIDLHGAGFVRGQFRSWRVGYTVAAIVCAITLIAQGVQKYEFTSHVHRSKNAPAESSSSNIAPKHVFISRPSPNVRESEPLLHFIKIALREKSDRSVWLSKGGRTQNLLWADRRWPVNFFRTINICEAFSQIVSRKLEIHNGVHFKSSGVSSVFPLGNEVVPDDGIYLSLVDDNTQWNDQGIVKNYRGPLRVIEIVFFSLRSTGPENKEARCYSGIYGYGYERAYAPCAILLLVFIVFSLSGLIFSSKGFKRRDRKGTILIFHGWLSFVIALVAAAWLITGEHVFISSSAERVSAAPGIDASATCYSRAENVRVLPIVIPELKLGNVERHVLGADLVERANHAAFQDRPEDSEGPCEAAR